MERPRQPLLRRMRFGNEFGRIGDIGGNVVDRRCRVILDGAIDHGRERQDGIKQALRGCDAAFRTHLPEARQADQRERQRSGGDGCGKKKQRQEIRLLQGTETMGGHDDDEQKQGRQRQAPAQIGGMGYGPDEADCHGAA